MTGGQGRERVGERMAQTQVGRAAGRVGPVERNALIAVSLVILFVGARAVFGPEERLAFLFYDDAYYYLGVARHLATAAGSTFDGLNPTNGYHPLWCWLLVPVFLFVDNPDLAVRAAAMRWFLLSAAVPWALWWSLRRRTGAVGSVMAAALFGLHPFVALGLARPNGLETPLYALLIALFIGVYERVAGRGDQPPGGAAGAATGPETQPVEVAGRRRWPALLLLGMLLGLVILARMDGGLLAVAAALLLGLHVWRSQGAHAAAKALAPLVLGAVVMAGPSLGWNMLRFGHPMPVSGRMVSLGAERERAELGGALSLGNVRRRVGYGLEKIPLRFASTVVEHTALARPLWRSGKAGGTILLLSAATMVGLALRQRRRNGALSSDAFALLLLFGVLHYGAYVAWLWTGGEDRYRLYYFMPQALLLAAAVGASMGPPLARRPRGWRSRLAAATLLVICSAYLLYGVNLIWGLYQAEPGPVSARHIYGWVRRNLPDDAVLGARDAGKLGFFAGRPVVNLDGLINDQHLLAAIRGRTEDDYIASSPIRYLFYDRDWIGDFDPERPGEGSAPGTAAILRGLAAREGITLREIQGTPDNWIVLQVIRD